MEHAASTANGEPVSQTVASGNGSQAKLSANEFDANVQEEVHVERSLADVDREKRMLEEENKRKRGLITQAIAQRKHKTMAEAAALNQLQVRATWMVF